MRYLFAQSLALLKQNLQAVIGVIILISSAIFIIMSSIIALSGFINLTSSYFNQYHYSLLFKSQASNDDFNSITAYLKTIKPDLSITKLSQSQLLDNITKNLNIANIPDDVQLFSGALEFSLNDPSSQELQKIDLLSQNEAIDNIISNKGLTEQLHRFLDNTRLLFLLLVAMSGAGLFLAIYVVMQLLIYSNAKLIKVLYDLGAHNIFIIKPFLATSSLISLFSFFLAIIACFGCYQLFYNLLSKLGFGYYLAANVSFYTSKQLILAAVFLLVTAIGSSLIAYFKAIKKLRSW